MADSPSLSNLKKAFPDNKIVEHRVYVIDNNLYGGIKIVAATQGVQDNTVKQWVKEGLTYSPYKSGNLHLMRIRDVFKWYKENKDPKQALNIKKTGQKAVSIPMEASAKKEQPSSDNIIGKIEEANRLLDLETTTQDDAERIAKILTGLKTAVSIDKETRELIPKRDLKKSILEWLLTFKNSYKKQIKLLPQELAMRDKEEIRNILEKSFKTELENFSKIAKSEVYDSHRITDGVMKVYDLISNGVSIKNILKKLRELDE